MKPKNQVNRVVYVARLLGGEEGKRWKREGLGERMGKGELYRLSLSLPQNLTFSPPPLPQPAMQVVVVLLKMVYSNIASADNRDVYNITLNNFSVWIFIDHGPVNDCSRSLSICKIC